MKTITVILCDDHTFVRQGLRLLLESAGDIEVVAEVEDGRRVVRETKRLLPDIVLMDLSMPELGGVEAAREIASKVPSAKVIMLSAFTDDQHVQDAVAAGVAGYLTKGTCTKELFPAIREVARGGTFFSRTISRYARKQPRPPLGSGRRVTAQTSCLTRRQRQILKLIAEGYPNKEMAGSLSISVKTVEKHRQEVMDRLNLHNVAVLTSYAVSHGIVEPFLDLHRA